MQASDNQEKQQKSPAKRFLFIFGLVVGVLYLVLGVCIIFWDKLPISKIIVLELSAPRRWCFAILLVGYAFFRFYRLQRSQN